MKILYVQDSLGTGGAERSNAELWYYLKAQGINLKIIVLEHRSEGIETEVLENDLDVHFLKAGNFLNQSKQIARVIRAFEPDIVHSVLIKASFRTRLAKIWVEFYHLESLVNCTYDKVRFEDPKVNKVKLNLIRIFDRYSGVNGANAFIAITEEVKRHHKIHLGIPEPKISVIYRGRKNNPFLSRKNEISKNVREEFGLSPEDIIFIHVGRQEFQKGHLNLLKAVKKYDEILHSKNVKFLFCGRKGNESKRINDFLAATKLKTEVFFLGHRSDVNRILAGADVFVFPSLYEGLGGSLLEAQAAGLPIICSDIEVFKEIVKEDINALLFPVSDCDELGKTLVIMAESETLRIEMGKKSMENFENRFTLDRINSQMLNHYREIIS